MSRPKPRVQAFGLCALVLSLFALNVGTAQAESSANWMVSGSNISMLKPAFKAELEGGEKFHITLSASISGIGVTLLCDHFAVAGALFWISGNIPEGIVLIIDGCQILLNGKVSAACEPLNEGKVAGEVKTKELKGLLVLHTGEVGLIAFAAKTGETIATIEMSKECPIGTKVPIIGKFTFQDAALTTEAVTHLVQPGPLTELWTISKTAEHQATIKGSVLLALSGFHAGLKWSGLPG